MISSAVWTIARVGFGAVGVVAVLVAVVGIVGIIRGKNALSGAKDMDEFVKWHWSDQDQAAAVLRTRVHLLSVVLSSGAAALSFGIFGRQFEAVILFAWCISLFGIALWWWFEREFAWPGWFIPREVRGTRGLFQARREARRRSRLGEGSENLDSR